MLVITHGLYINLVVSGMRANELDPYDAGDVLHLYDQVLLVAAITFILGGCWGGGMCGLQTSIMGAQRPCLTDKAGFVPVGTVCYALYCALMTGLSS